MTTTQEWSGSPDPRDPDNFWIDDETNERVSLTGERTKISAHEMAEIVKLLNEL